MPTKNGQCASLVLYFYPATTFIFNNHDEITYKTYNHDEIQWNRIKLKKSAVWDYLYGRYIGTSKRLIYSNLIICQ